METIIVELGKALIWGLVALLLGKGLVKQLGTGLVAISANIAKAISESITHLSGRLTRVGDAEFLPPGQQKALPAPSAETSPAAAAATTHAPAVPAAGDVAPVQPPTPDAFLLEQTGDIRQWISHVPPAQREETLIWHLAAWRLSWNFEVIHAWILGSQLTGLMTLNSRPGTLAEAQALYDQAAAAYPDYYRTYTFDQWLGWIVGTWHLARVDGQMVTITEAGRQFLRYLLSRQYPVLGRPG